MALPDFGVSDDGASPPGDGAPPLDARPPDGASPPPNQRTIYPSGVFALDTFVKGGQEMAGEYLFVLLEE